MAASGSSHREKKEDRRVLAICQPETDPSEVAQEVLAEVCELYSAATKAAAQPQDINAADVPQDSLVRRDGDEMVFSPGGELANLAMCLEVFATAVLKPASCEALVAGGASAYAASAWSADIGKAAGTLGCVRIGSGDRHQQSAAPTILARAIHRGPVRAMTASPHCQRVGVVPRGEQELLHGHRRGDRPG